MNASVFNVPPERTRYSPAPMHMVIAMFLGAVVALGIQFLYSTLMSGPSADKLISAIITAIIGGGCCILVGAFLGYRGGIAIKSEQIKVYWLCQLGFGTIAFTLLGIKAIQHKMDAALFIILIICQLLGMVVRLTRFIRATT